MANKKVCIAGSGKMGRQIGLCAAIAGYDVALYDAMPQVLDATAQWMEEYLAGRVAKGRMTQAQVDAIKGRVSIEADLGKACDGAFLVIEAIFEDEEQAAEVRAAIERCAPKSILVLGTSDRMVDIIAGRLGLPPVTEYIHIEDITTESQRNRAIDARAKGGMHVIPAPTIQVRKQFSGYFLDPKRSFRKTRAELGEQAGEKTVVRPKYSYFGKFDISEKVINDIASHIVSVTPGAVQLLLASSTADSDNNMYIRAVITVDWGSRVRAVAGQLQQALVEAVTAMTGFNILGVEVEVRGFRQRAEW